MTDEKEREHCERVIAEMDTINGPNLAVDLLMRERQAVRAELQEKIDDAAARASRWANDLDRERLYVSMPLKAELKAVNAQNDFHKNSAMDLAAQLERVTRECDAAFARLAATQVAYGQCMNQLSTLRAAAERFLGQYKGLGDERPETLYYVSNSDLRLLYEALDSTKGETK